jgi:hypothetical protein
MINHEEEIKYRLECLKMAYEFNFKVGNIKQEYTEDQTLTKELQDVFLLADMNFDFISEGALPSKERLIT